jgi:hypothetical protein
MNDTSIPMAGYPTLHIETQSGCNGAIDTRIVDYARKVKTPWLACCNEVLANTAAAAVMRTLRSSLTWRHTVDGEWIIVHTY